MTKLLNFEDNTEADNLEDYLTKLEDFIEENPPSSLVSYEGQARGGRVELELLKYGPTNSDTYGLKDDWFVGGSWNSYNVSVFTSTEGEIAQLKNMLRNLGWYILPENDRVLFNELSEINLFRICKGTDFTGKCVRDIRLSIPLTIGRRFDKVITPKIRDTNFGRLETLHRFYRGEI